MTTLYNITLPIVIFVSLGFALGYPLGYNYGTCRQADRIRELETSAANILAHDGVVFCSRKGDWEHVTIANNHAQIRYWQYDPPWLNTYNVLDDVTLGIKP